MAGESLFGFPDSGPAAATNTPFYLFGGDGRYIVRSRIRWVADNCIYVVAPLGTATAIKQRWQASAFYPADPDEQGRRRHVNVELISAEALLGSDSGNEGLLLRIAPADEKASAPLIMHPAVTASNLAAASSATAGV
ncbi:MAG TPA: hypothetical protein VM243_12125 [Phycisphaerae bacterium]|nr:hypothetical protein [Phycisphaerae bacterium]